MEQDKLEFQSSVEALFKEGLVGVLTSRLRTRLKEAGLDLERPLRPAYPASAFVRFLELAAEELYADQPRGVAFRSLGRRFAAAFLKSPVGKAAFDLMKVLGPRRSLERLQRTVRAANNYVCVSAEASELSSVELSVSESPGGPEFFLGVLEEGLKLAACTRDPSVELAAVAGTGGRYRVRWS